MPIFYNKVERVNPQKRKEPKKWYPSLKTIVQIQQKQVGKEIADETTLNPKEVEMALDQLQKVLIRNLLASNSVQLGLVFTLLFGKPFRQKREDYIQQYQEFED